jgi:hypothetical protein
LSSPSESSARCNGRFEIPADLVEGCASARCAPRVFAAPASTIGLCSSASAIDRYLSHHGDRPSGPTEASPREFDNLSDNAEDIDADILDVLLKELQDDDDEDPAPPRAPGRPSSSESNHRALNLSWSDSPRLNVHSEPQDMDLNVLDVLLNSLDANPSVGPTLPSAKDCLAEEMWAAPGWLHQPSRQ